MTSQPNMDATKMYFSNLAALGVRLEFEAHTHRGTERVSK